MKSQRIPITPVLTLALAALLASLATSIANIALPQIGQHFSLPLGQTQWVIQSYLIATTLGVLIAGSIGDRLGRWRVLRGSLLLFCVGSALAALAPSFPALILARALQGFAAAGLISLSLACARDLSESHTGRLIGLMGSLSAVGTALGPGLGGVLVTLAGWRASFVLLLALAVLGWVLSLVRPAVDAPETKVTSAKRAMAGSVPFATTLLLLALGLIRLPELDGAVLVAAGVLAAAFLHKRPLALTDLSPLGLIANALVAATMMSTLILTPFYLTGTLGLSLHYAGLLMTLGPCISIFAGAISGIITDRFMPAHVRSAGLSLMALGCAVLGLFSTTTEIAPYVIGILLLTPAYQLFQAANNTLLISGSPADRRGEISAWLGLSRNIGLISGAAVSALVYQHIASTPAAAFSLTFILATLGLTLTGWLTHRAR